MRAVVIGAGRIGCGFVGQLLRRSGWEVTIAARRPVLEVLAAHHRYIVRTVDGPTVEDEIVDDIDVVDASNATATIDAIATADLVATAVGPANLAHIAPLLATGLARREVPATVVAFENLVRAGTHLREQTALHLPTGFPLGEHHFSGAVVSRAVSHRLAATATGPGLVFVGDSLSVFHVDGGALRMRLPTIEGMVTTDQFEAHAHRKLYTYSAGHAATAYLGALKGYHYIHTASRDPEIRAAVRAAMAEGQRGLARRYGDDLAGTDADLDAILARFDNAGLADPIARVGRDARRKLAADDRLVGAARLAAAGGTAPSQLALAIAAALVFHDPTDALSTAWHREVGAVGVAGVLRAVCHLRSDTGVGRMVAGEFRSLSDERSSDAVLLSLARRQWSWTSADPAAGVVPSARM